MNRIVNFSVLFAIAAIVFCLVTCSNPSNNPIDDGGALVDSSSSNDPPRGNGPDQDPGLGLGQESSPSGEVSSNSFGDSSSGSSSSGTQTASSSSSDSESSSSVRSSSSYSSAVVFEPPDPKSFTETANGVSFDMIYIPGGTFTLGCEKSSGCPANTSPVEGVTMSNYFIAKTETTVALWHAVMGTTCSGYTCYGASSASMGSPMTWYDAHEFACKLGQLTGKNYHMITEAEFEYAAKNQERFGKLEKIGGGSGNNEEWAYNTWDAKHSGGTDPIGPISKRNGEVTWGHTQKTRRDANGTGDNITGRLIRSVEGVGPALRLAISAEQAYPPNMIPPCNIHAPELGEEPPNSYRDPRWVTGSGAKWGTGSGTAVGSFELRVWADGTAKYGSTNGQWFTSNNITFVFVPSSGSTVVRFAYIFLNDEEGSLITDQSFTYSFNGPSTGFIGRIAKEETSNVDKPSVTDLKTGEALAKAQSDFNARYKMVNMENIPSSAKEQDRRLLDGKDSGWFQNNIGSAHHYRKDVDLDEFRFTVNQLPGPDPTILTNGTWFTVNNTFLRVTHKDSKVEYVTDYLYAVSSDNNGKLTFYHNSFQKYERGDFRMFTKTANNSSAFINSCGDLCKDEIPKGLGASMYAPGGYMADVGFSTFTPAKCPTGGCN